MALFCSCSESDDQLKGLTGDNIIFSADIYSSETKAPVLDENGKGIFSDGDPIVVIGAGYDEYAYNYSSSEKILIPEDKPISWETSLISSGAKDKRNFYAKYLDINTPGENQAPDHLVASTIYQKETRHIAFNFTHAMAKVMIDLTLGGGIIWNEKCKVLINGLNSNFKFDYKSNHLVVVPDDSNVKREPIAMDASVNGNNVSLSAIVVEGGQKIENIEIYAASNGIGDNLELKLFRYVPSSDFIQSGHIRTLGLHLVASDVHTIDTKILKWEGVTNSSSDSTFIQLITKATEPVDYKITCPGNMLWLSEQAQNNIENTNTYTVVNDIDMRCYPNWVPVGTKDCPFKGSIIGQNKKFFGLNVTKDNGLISLFGYMDGSKLDSINVTARFTNKGTNEGSLTASIAAVAKNSVIKNCNAALTIKANYIAGGIVAISDNSVINNCNVSGSVTAVVTGGIVGQNYSGNILASSNTASVYSKQSPYIISSAGGIAAENDGYVIASKNTGKISLVAESNNLGDIIGAPLTKNSVIYSSWTSSGVISGGNANLGTTLYTLSTAESQITDYDVAQMNTGIDEYNNIVSSNPDKVCYHIWNLTNGKLTLEDTNRD